MLNVNDEKYKAATPRLIYVKRWVAQAIESIPGLNTDREGGQGSFLVGRRSTRRFEVEYRARLSTNLRRWRRSSIPNFSRTVRGIEAWIPSTACRVMEIERPRIEGAPFRTSLQPPPSLLLHLEWSIGTYC